MLVFYFSLCRLFASSFCGGASLTSQTCDLPKLLENGLLTPSSERLAVEEQGAAQQNQAQLSEEDQRFGFW